jgi:hypothetical protein
LVVISSYGPISFCVLGLPPLIGSFGWFLKTSSQSWRGLRRSGAFLVVAGRQRPRAFAEPGPGFFEPLFPQMPGNAQAD